jgi:hypothetical protein
MNRATGRPLRMSMVVRELRYRDGRLRARFRSGKWQFPDRIPGYLGHDGERSLAPLLASDPIPAVEIVAQLANPSPAPSRG